MPEITETVRVQAPRELVFELLSDPDTFLEIVNGLERAERDGRILRWEADGPLGVRMQGEAEITRDQPPETLVWNSVDGALDAHGSMELGEEGDVTIVRYTLSYEIPGGAAGEAVAGLADPDAHVRDMLDRFKRLAERRRDHG